MKYIINLKFNDLLEGGISTKIIPIIFDNKVEAEKIKDQIERHNDFINFYCSGTIFRKNEKFKKPEFDLKSQCWYVNDVDTIEYSLITLHDDKTYDVFFQEKLNLISSLDYKFENDIDFLRYIKLCGNIIYVDWNDFSTKLEEVSICEISDIISEKYNDQIDDLNMNNIFKCKTTLPLLNTLYPFRFRN